MDRRSFIGSVIGTLASGNAFYAIAPPKVPELTNSQRLVEFARIFDTSEFDLRTYKMFAVAEGNIRFMSPGIAKVQRKQTSIRFYTTFVASPITTKQTIIILGYGLLNPSGRLLRIGRFSSPVTFLVGDSLNVTYTVSADVIQIESFPEE